MTSHKTSMGSSYSTAKRPSLISSSIGLPQSRASHGRISSRHPQFMHHSNPVVSGVKLCPWPEWSDNDINNEKWEVIPATKTKVKPPTQQTGTNSFDDIEGRNILPPPLIASSWKRPADCLASGMKGPVVYSPGDNNDHLICNQTLLQIPLYRNIISIIYCLEEVTREIGYSVDWPTQQYIPNSANYWRPWNHVYGMCKAGKGVNHNPQYNPYGKYYVRLFVMGYWRKIVVDDYLPFNNNNMLLLPSSNNKMEIWPFILIKGLLKVATKARLWSDIEIDHFDVVECLTGWLPECRKLSDFPVTEDLLEYLSPGLVRYKWAHVSSMDTTSEPTLRNESSVDTMHLEAIPSSEHSEKHNMKGREEAGQDKAPAEEATGKKKVDIKAEPVVEENEEYKKLRFLVFASLRDKEMLPVSEKLNGFAHLPHYILLAKFRNIPLKPPPPKPSTPNWKKIRRLKYPPAEDTSPDRPIRAFEICSPFLSYKFANDITGIAAEKGAYWCPQEMDSLMASSGANKALKTSALEMKSQVNSEVKSESTKRSKKTSISQDTVSFVNQTVASFSNSLFYHTRVWLTLDDLKKYFDKILIYHRVPSYKNFSRYSDLKMTSEPQKDAPKKMTDHDRDKKNLTSQLGNDNELSGTPTLLLENSSLYLFSDSLESTYINIGFSVVYHPVSIFMDHRRESEVTALESSYGGCSNAEGSLSKMNQHFTQINRLCLGSLVIQTYNWRDPDAGDEVHRIMTYGSRVFKLSLPSGRHVFKLSFSTPSGYVISLFSDNLFLHGSEEFIQTLMSSISQEALEVSEKLLGLLISGMRNFGHNKKKSQIWREIILTLKEDLDEDSKSFRSYASSRVQEAFKCLVYKGLARYNPELLSKSTHGLLAFFLDPGNHSRCERIIQKRGKPEEWEGTGKDSSEKKKATKMKDTKSKKEASSAAQPGNKKAAEELELILKNTGHFTRDDVLNVQGIARSFLLSRAMEANLMPGPLYTRAMDQLSQVADFIESNKTYYLPTLIKKIIKFCHMIVSKGSLGPILQHILSYKDYSGSPSELMSSSFPFTCYFRQIVHVSENMDVLFRPFLIQPFALSKVWVVNNDTGEILTPAFGRTPALNLKHNKEGYTVMACSMGNIDTFSGLKWNLRMISTCQDQPFFWKPGTTTLHDTLDSDLKSWEASVFYCPRDDGQFINDYFSHFCRHGSVDKCSISIAVKTSKPTAKINLKILNSETNDVIQTCDGMGCVFIPMVTLCPKVGGCDKEGKSQTDWSRVRLVGTVVDGSWSLTESQLRTANSWKEKLKDRRKVLSQMDSFETHGKQSKKKEHQTPQKNEPRKESRLSGKNKEMRHSSNRERKKKGKEVDSPEEVQDKEDESYFLKRRQSLEALHGIDQIIKEVEMFKVEEREEPAMWSLLFFTNKLFADHVVFHVNMEKEEEIQKVKMSWEEAQPGRAAKALQAKLQYYQSFKKTEFSAESIGVEERYYKPKVQTSKFKAEKKVKGGKEHRREDMRKPLEDVDVKWKNNADIPSLSFSDTRSVMIFLDSNPPPPPPIPVERLGRVGEVSQYDDSTGLEISKSIPSIPESILWDKEKEDELHKECEEMISSFEDYKKLQEKKASFDLMLRKAMRESSIRIFEESQVAQAKLKQFRQREESKLIPLITEAPEEPINPAVKKADKGNKGKKAAKK